MSTWTQRRAHLGPRPYDVASLAAAIGLDPQHPHLTSLLCRRLGIERSWVRRCRSIGLTAQGADHWAARAGLHPDIVWPGWEDDPEGDDIGSLPGEDDPPLAEVEPISPERLAVLRSSWRRAA